MPKPRRPPQLHRRGKPNELAILAIADIRSQPLDDLVGHVRRLQTPVDLIVYAGDDVARFRKGSTNYFEELASLSRLGLVGVVGNDDGPEARHFLSGRHVYDVHAQPIRIADILVIGIEGAPNRRGIGIGSPLYSEIEIAQHIRASVRGHRGAIFVVSHAPPFKVLDLAMRFGINNIGSKALREFLRTDTRVELVICGHCHREGGKAHQFHQATVINAASHDDPDELVRIGHYRWRRGYRLMSGSPAVTFEHARPWGELEAITGLWHTDHPKLWKAGITTVAQLAATTAESLGGIVGRRPEHVRQFPILARARLASEPLPIRPLYAPKPRVFFDIETDPHGGNKLCWLIGLLDEQTGTFTQYLARTPAEEPTILSQFATFCSTLQDRSLVSYSGSNFDHRNVIARMEALSLPVPAPLERAVDLLYPIQNSIAWPCTGYRLKDIAACLGFTYRHRGLDGFMVALEYLRLSERKRPIPRRFLEYNEDDLRALRHIVVTVEEIAGYGGWPPPRQPRGKKAMRADTAAA